MHSATLRRGLAAASSLLLAGAVVATAAPSSDAAPAARTATHTRTISARAAFGSTRHYALVEPLCGTPKNPMAMRCFAERLVPASRNTPGARSYLMSDAAAAGPTGNGYTPGDIAKAYGMNPALPRSTQTVAVVNWFRDPNALHDLDAFDAYYHLPQENSKTFRQVSQTGGSVAGIKTDEGAAGEQSLDIEAIRGLCHSCKILLVEANNGDDNDIAAAENEAARLGATEINNSFGEPERKYSSAVINAYNHPGVVITASTGDSGWYNWDYVNAGNTVSANAAQFPADSPYVVSVGGTTLGLTASATRSVEIDWNENGQEDADGLQGGPQGAGGSGCSRYFAAPAWQLHYPGYAAAGCNGHRLSADISADADSLTGLDVYDSFHPSHPTQANWETIGGTSLAAPLTAAMYALAGGSGGTAYPASALYVNAHLYPSSVYDVQPLAVENGQGGYFATGNGFCADDNTTQCADAIYNGTSGTNNNPNGVNGWGAVDCSFPRGGANVATAPALNPECNTVKGYDGPTGLGTPNSVRLYERTNPSLAIGVPSGLKQKTNRTYTVSVHEYVPGTAIVRYYWTWGDGHTSSTTSARATHVYARSGRYTVRVSVSTSRYQTSTTVRGITVGR